MLRIDYTQTDYKKVLEAFSEKMNATIKDDTLVIPDEIANGYFKHTVLSNGLQCLISDYTLHTDLYLQRTSSDKEFYILRFDEVSISDTLMVKIDNDYIWESKHKRASVLLTSSLFDFATSATKGTVVRSINVLFTRKWLSQYLNINSLDSILQKYLQLKTNNYNFAPFDIEYRSWFNEVLGDSNAVMQKPIIENRIMLMVEKFLNNLYENSHHLSIPDSLKIPNDEVKRLMEVESYLVKDFSTPPPPISFLSKGKKGYLI